MKRSFRTWFLTVTIILILFVVVFFTYAWFTSNRAVSTNTVTARTDEENLELHLSSTFRDSQPASITQVNKTDAEYLIPVSTNDLQNFVYSPFTDSGMASSFERVQNEEYYYHGRVYIRAVGEGMDDGSTMKLYLDQSDGILGQKVSGQMLNAARLGLVFDENYSSVKVRMHQVSRHTIQSLTGRHLGTIRYCHTQTGQYGRLPTRLYRQMDIPSVFQTIL